LVKELKKVFSTTLYMPNGNHLLLLFFLDTTKVRQQP